MGTSAALAHTDARRLAHGVVAEAARRCDARALVVKGLASDFHGLRTPRESADVDVLVAPEDVVNFVACLKQFGWHERVVLRLMARISEHARTFVHDEWPCDIDVHVDFPGLLREPVQAFDALWQTRTEIDVAGVRVAIPGRVACAILNALHTQYSDPRGVLVREEYAQLVDNLRGAVDSSELARTAQALGADRTAQNLLADLDVEPLTNAEAYGRDLREWRRLTGNGATTSAWVGYLLRRAPWRERPAIILDALSAMHDTRRRRADSRAEQHGTSG